MVDIGINAWSFLFDNLKINIILQDYLKSVWKTVIIRETAAANQSRRFKKFGISISISIAHNIWARDLKNSGKYGSGLSCRWTLFTAWAFGLKLHLIFYRVELKKPV